MIQSKVPVIAITAVRTGAGQEPDHPLHQPHPEEPGQEGRGHPPPHALRRSRRSRPASASPTTPTSTSTSAPSRSARSTSRTSTTASSSTPASTTSRSSAAPRRKRTSSSGTAATTTCPSTRRDLHICIADPLRPGHEMIVPPGRGQLPPRRRHPHQQVRLAPRKRTSRPSRRTPRSSTRRPRVIRANSPVTCDKPEMVKGKKVLVIEDGPTLTHGSMTYGAGVVAAKRNGAAEIVDPTPYAVGSITATYEKYPNAQGILPAMGYGDAADHRARGDHREDPVRRGARRPRPSTSPASSRSPSRPSASATSSNRSSPASSRRRSGSSSADPG